MKHMPPIILASTSPRRKELLSLMGIPFTTLQSDFDETFIDSASAFDEAERIALGKATIVAKKNTNAFVIGADTFIYFNDKKIGKPQSREEAITLLQSFSGATHSVFTGLALVHEDKSIRLHTVIEAKVTFRVIQQSEIEAYLNTHEYVGKAGAYAIQQKASVFISHIEGDFSAIVGLPLVPLIHLFSQAGFPLNDLFWQQE